MAAEAGQLNGIAMKPSKRRHLIHKKISAEEFRLVSKRGRCKAKLCLSGAGGPSLMFLDDRGKLRVSIYLHGDQVGIEFLNKKEKVRACLGLGPGGEPSLQLLDSAERVHACLEMCNEDDPGLDLYDKRGNLRASLSLMGKEEIPNLAVIDRNGKRRKVIPKGHESDAALAFYDENEEGVVMVGPGPWSNDK